MGRLDGKVALVTGAGSGIGRAAALAFVREGARVVVADVSAKGGEETVRMIKEAGGEAFFVKCDVSNENDVKALVAAGARMYGRLDCAANNAGIDGEPMGTVECTESNWQKVIDINLKGVWLCMKYEIPEMLRQGGGAIVNTASMCGLIGKGRVPYVASKHGVIGATKAAAIEYGSQGIRINAVCPGIIRTPMVDAVIRQMPDVMKGLTDVTPMARVGNPEEIASAIVWLCTDDASFVTAAALSIDGGFVAQ
ncbi:MAG: SDR family oxidoreductase [Chloroflexi bacterium]|nr:SDR family oxidoreductase [Chloroflexota bacterium]